MTSRPFVLVLIVFAGALVAAQQPAAPPTPPEPPPLTFRIEVNYVEVDAIVTDADGNAVTDLTLDDFEVLEDGKPQKVTAFSRVQLPIERAERPLFAAAPIEPDVQDNDATDGRLYLFLLDDLHTSFTNTPRVKAALRQFIGGSFGTNDLAAVVHTSGRRDAGQDFTNNPRLLLAASDKFIGRNLPSATAERLAGGLGSCGASSGGLSGVADPCEAERGFNARTAMSSVRKLADFMTGVRGRRKAMVLVSEGISYDVFDVFNNRSASTILDETREAIAAATRGNVAIYAIDPRGLGGLGNESAEIGSSGDPSGAGSAFAADSAAANGSNQTGPTQSPASGFQSELSLSQHSLRTLTSETGGFAALNRNDFTDAFARIVSENSRYYVLGYYPANERRDGRFRRIDVRVKRPGVQVRARRGYVAPRGRAPESARNASRENVALAIANEALGSPIPIGGVPLTVFAAPYKGTAPNASVAVAVEFGVGDFRFTEENGTMNGRAEMTFTSTSNEGKVLGSGRHAIDLALKPDTFARAREHGLRVVTQTELPPGRYQFRVAIGEAGGRAGSVLYDLEVPDFYRGALTMSGVSVTAASSVLAPTVLPKNPLADFLPGPPVTRREFERKDELALFAEFYENARGAPTHRFDITTTVRAEGGRTVFQNTDERSSTELQGRQGGYGHSVRLPLRDLDPGLYVIRVEGRSRIGDRENAVGRDVQIRIR
jgi:VWFA-related protein